MLKTYTVHFDEHSAIYNALTKAVLSENWANQLLLAIHKEGKMSMTNFINERLC